jgi:hypothetical protein
MKKILLLSIASLAMLMADFTLEGDKLTPVSGTITTVTDPTPPSTTTDPTPPSTTTDPVSPSGVIPNSVDLIVADRDEPNKGFMCQTQSGYPQFQGAYSSILLPSSSVSGLNAWYQIMEEGDGSSCSYSMSQSSNTVVELGNLRGWYLKTDGTWVQFENSRLHTGLIMPNPGDPYFSGNYGQCGATFDPIRAANPNPQLHKGVSENGFELYRPENYWVWHGFGSDGGRDIVSPNDVKAIIVTIYARLVKLDKNGVDDRHLAKYVIHVGSDNKRSSDWYTLGDIGISRTKRITNDWQPINFLSGGISKEELIASNPPVQMTP